MANPHLAPVIRTSLAAMATDRGQELEHYQIPLDFPLLYRWIPGNQATVDGLTVITHSGGTVGRHHLVRCPDRGADLTNANVTIQVGDGFWRVLPTATLTGNKTLTLGTTNAANGDILDATRLDAEAFSFTIVNGGIGAGTLCTLASGQRWWVRFAFDGADWSLRSGGQLPG